MKKTLKNLTAVLLAVITAFSCFVFAQANGELTEKEALVRMIRAEEIIRETKPEKELSTQSIYDYNHLRKHLINSGSYDSDLNLYYFMVSEYFSGYGTNKYAVVYDPETDDLLCLATFFDYQIETVIYLESDYSDGLYSGVVYTDGPYQMTGTAYVNPKTYPYDIFFYIEDQNGNGNSSDTLLQDVMNAAYELTVYESNDIIKSETGITLGNFGFTKLYGSVQIYEVFTIYFDAMGGYGAPPTIQVVSDDRFYISHVNPIKPGYKFLGWSPSPDADYALYLSGHIYPLSLFYNDSCTATLYAVWEVDPNYEPPKPPEPPNFEETTFGIANNTGSVEIEMYTVVLFGSDYENLPKNFTARTKWYVDGKEVEDSSINFKDPGTYTVTAKLTDSNGNIVHRKDGSEISDSITVVVDGRFFSRIFAFIRYFFLGYEKYYHYL